MSEGPVRDHELEALAREVRAEFDGLRLCTTLTISLYGKDGVAGLLSDLAIPGLNLHGRLLVSFFSPPPRRPRPDDVFAHHFVPDWDGDRDAGGLAWLRAAFVPGVNKRSAHLSARRVRVDPNVDSMQVAEIYMSIAWAMQHFLEKLPPERLSWFERNGELPDTTPSALLVPSGRGS